MRIAWAFFFLTFSTAATSSAKILLDVGVGYFSDAVTTSTSDSSSKLAYNVGGYIGIRKNLWGGWSYTGVSNAHSAGSTNTNLSGTGMGPAFKWQFGRGQTYSLTMVYNFMNNATYTTGSSTEEWQGTSYFVQFGAMPELGEGWHVGLALNYYGANYTTRKVNKVESNVSYTQTWIYPSFSITKDF